MPLCLRASNHVADALQTWYADDLSSAGQAHDNAAMFAYIVQHEQRYGYFPEPAKSSYVCKEEDEAIEREEFQSRGLCVQYTQGHRYLGGFLGSSAAKKEWVESLIQVWTRLVETLVDIAQWYLQSAFTGFTFCLQCEWAYVMRVVSGIAAYFEPLEVAIRSKVLPALFNVDHDDVKGE